MVLPSNGPIWKTPAASITFDLISGRSEGQEAYICLNIKSGSSHALKYSLMMASCDFARILLMPLRRFAIESLSADFVSPTCADRALRISSRCFLRSAYADSFRERFAPMV